MRIYHNIKQTIWFQKLLILLLLAGLIVACPAQETGQPIQFRRWLAPLDRIDDWPYGPGRYLPLDRKVFEQWTEWSQKTSEQIKPEEWNGLTRIVLEAKLEGRQLVQGKGSFEIQKLAGNFKTKYSDYRSISLDSWKLWIDQPTLEDGTPVSLVREPDDKIHLILPKDTTRVRFHWSLRSRNESQLSFDFSLPPCPAVELLLDLPATMVPALSNGIVMEEPEKEEQKEERNEKSHFRRWRLFPGRNTPTVLTITLDETFQPARQKTAIQQIIRYSITPKGTDVMAKIFFDKADARLNELFLELESPLRVVDIRYGEQPVLWSQLTTEEKSSVTRIHLDFSGNIKEESRELTIEAVCSVHENQPWSLPRIRVVSSNVFWKETRCGVHVQSPFLVRNIFCERAVQVTPRNPVDRSDWEQFVFQFFEEDSQITVDFAPHVPRLHLNSAVQVQWGNNEIRGNMIVDGHIVDGDRYTLEFPISPHWTIDSIRSVYWTVDSTKVFGSDEILTWDIINAQDSLLGSSPEPEETGEQSKLLLIQLKHLLRSRKSFRLQLTGRFQAGSPNANSQEDFRLSDLSPLSLPRRQDEFHYLAIAVQSTIPYHLQYRSQNHSSFEIHDSDSRLSQRFGESPTGTVFPLNAQTQEIRFGMERLKPNYTAEIIGTILLKEKELVSTFRFRCQPVDSSVDRVYVHLTPQLREKISETQNGTWTWFGVSESIQPLQVRLLSEKEQREIFPFQEPQNFETLSNGSINPIQGETWEVRLATPQTTAFEFRSVSSIPLSDSMPVPLAALPLAVTQKGEIYIESPKLFPYHVLNSRLKSIPIAPTEWYRYQEIRSAFRYDPVEEIRFALPSPLSLQRLSREETPPSAWIWSLRLNTQYESEGIVKDNAIFLLENHGKETLRIRLPDGIDVSNVLAVWRDDRPISWHPEYENDSDKTDKTYKMDKPIKRTENAAAQQLSASSKPSQNVVVISLPEGTRFVSVSLEYSHQNIPLTDQQKLEPQYPTADIPILSEHWTLWFPPEFEVSWSQPVTANTSEYRSFPLSAAMNHLLMNSRFDPFSLAAWREFLWGKSRYQDAELASQIFFNWMTTGLKGTIGQQNPIDNYSEKGFLLENIAGGFTRTESKTTWATILSNEKRLLEMLGEIRRDDEKGVEAKIVIDKQSLAILGMTPSTPVLFPDLEPAEKYNVFERAGLVLLVSSKIRPDRVKEYTFYITTFLTSSLHRHFFSKSISNCSQYVPETVNLTRFSSDQSILLKQTGFGNPQWVPLEEWLKETTPFSMPWSISPPMLRLASVMPNWMAFELPGGSGQSLYIVHQGTFAAYHWLAFLTVVVLATRKPFSSPIFLFVLLILFEILTRLVVPSLSGIPSGAFWGTAVSLGFGMIRSRSVMDLGTKFRRTPHQSGSTDKQLTASTNSEN
ncbi:MAG: hypothetical protein LBQ50_07825 [Planctomycetaceae bacterium]|jgi:hypothetical protein|nr:hypothetical protein [Planctomycetaceae bacterium]